MVGFDVNFTDYYDIFMVYKNAKQVWLRVQGELLLDLCDSDSEALEESHEVEEQQRRVFTSASNLFPRLISLIAHPALIERCVICFYDKILTKMKMLPSYCDVKFLLWLNPTLLISVV
ncbi:hypothetical protein IMY05_007G0058600 [Salix suchowensis]|nr:hypothetical protein IMY05_007G0058600 [Salix suchowensis]